MDEIIEKPDSFSEESEETVDQPDKVDEPPREESEVVSSDKAVSSETLVNPTVNEKTTESCSVVLPVPNKQKESSFMSYLLAHPLLLLLAVVCLVAVVYLILDFLRGFFPWMQN